MNFSDQGEPRSRTAARQACDLCRVRKTRCHGGPPRSNRTSDAHKVPCLSCEHEGAPCTFDMPVKKRGRPPRDANQQTVRSTADVAATPARLDQLDSQPTWHISDDFAERDKKPAFILCNEGLSPPSHFAGGNSSLLRTGTSAASSKDGFATDIICPRVLFDAIIQDFLDIIYPLAPVIHRPTFLADLKNQRELYDVTFLCLLGCMCATVVAAVPRKFPQYRSSATPLGFRSRTEMVEHCYAINLRMRTPDYFDKPSHLKWAISYLLLLSNGLLSSSSAKGRIPMIVAEVMQQALSLRLHDPETYARLDLIQQQLQKKAFWMTFSSNVYSQFAPEQLGCVKMLDLSAFDGIDADAFIPMEVDDEYITNDSVLSQPPDVSPITAGFNANCHIYWDSVTLPFPASELPVTSSDAEKQLASLSVRLQRLKHALDKYLPKLGLWNSSEPADDSDVLHCQWESIRANVHVVHLWLQSVLFEQIITLTKSIRTLRSDFDNLVGDKTIWNEREDICRKLLHVLYNTSAVNLEPNGTILARHIRRVAATLLDCPFERQGDIVRRSKDHIQNFIDLLVRLDISDTDAFEEQAWVDLDNYSRRVISEFSETS